MLNDHTTPLGWLLAALDAIKWPVVVYAAFRLGRIIERLEVRVRATEANIKALIERHLPHVHRALADIRGKLETVQALVTRRRDADM